MRSIDDILLDIHNRTIKGSDKYYSKLEDEEERILLHNWYKNKINIPIDGCKFVLKNKLGTKISSAYTRVVIGDFGPYIEFIERDAYLENFTPRWSGEPNRPIKYLWLQTKDELKTKIYLQKQKVSYAAYLPGCYYISPDDIDYY